MEQKLEECNLKHVSHVEPAYVEAHEQTMEPSLQAATATCLRGKGFEPRGTERNVKAFADSTDGVGNAVMECVTTSMRQLLPRCLVSSKFVGRDVVAGSVNRCL